MAVIYNIQEAVNNSAFNVLQEPIKMVLDKEMEAFEKTDFISKIFVMKTSDKYREEYRTTTAMDNFRPTEDMEVAGLSDFEESYNKQFVFQTWTNSFVVSKQTVEDGMLSIAEIDAKKFIKSFPRTRALYAARMLGAALGNTYADYKIDVNSGKGMDTVDGAISGVKQQYFHKAHKTVQLKNGSTPIEQSNKFVANIDLTAVTAEEKLLDVIGQVESIMGTYKDDKGNIVPVVPTRIVIGEDFALKDKLLRGLKSQYGSRMGDNGVNLYYGKWEVIVVPYLSDIVGFRNTDHGMLLVSPDRNEEGMGAVFFDRIPLTVRSYMDDKTEANIVSGRARFGAGFGDFRAISYIHIAESDATATEITPSV